jgi:hypothetical protein
MPSIVLLVQTHLGCMHPRSGVNEEAVIPKTGIASLTHRNRPPPTPHAHHRKGVIVGTNAHQDTDKLRTPPINAHIVEHGQTPGAIGCVSVQSRNTLDGLWIQGRQGLT